MTLPLLLSLPLCSVALYVQAVVLHVYDLSMGMAKSLSPAILGKQIDGIWHTGVFAFGSEFFYGGGIQAMSPHEVTATFGMRPVQVS